MASRSPFPDDRRVYDAPLHVVRSSDGSVTIFFPDGHRMALTAEAAERSGAMLWRTGVAQRESRASARQARRPGQVITVDFGGRQHRA